MERNWDTIKAVLTELVAYFKKVFQYFGYIPKEEEAE